MLHLSQFEHIAVQSLAELSVLHEYLHVLFVTGENSCGVVHNVGIIAEKYDSVYVVENRGWLAVYKGVILDAVGKYLPCPQSVNISAEMFAYCVHALAADLFAELLYPVRKLLVVVEDLPRGIYLNIFERIRAALCICLKFGYAVYLVAPELYADRLVSLHGVYVQYGATYGEL